MNRMKKMTIRRAEGLAAGAHYIESGPVRTQNPQQFNCIQPMAAHYGAVQQQDRYMQSVPPLQFRVGVHVQHGHRRQHFAPAQRCELRQHLVAQLTVLPLHYCEAHA
jgi:hypothetical protein